MTEATEYSRLYSLQNGELPNQPYAEILFRCDEPQECLDRIITVMSKIVVHDRSDWPVDEAWRQILPDWLLRTFTTYSPSEIEQILADKSSWADLDWTFGSWLDRMQDRDWKWWSTKTAENSVTITIRIEGEPFSAKALEHLIRSAGGILL